MVPAAIEDVSDLVLLVLFAHEKGGISPFAGVTRLQKLLFLLTRRGTYASLVSAGQAPALDFEPYRMGPFTPEVYDAVQVLSSFTPPLLHATTAEDEPPDGIELARYVDELDLDRVEPAGSPTRPTTFELTDEGRTVAKWIWESIPGALRDDINRIERSYGRLPLRELLRVVYEQFPDMTTRSEIKGQLGIPQ